MSRTINIEPFGRVETDIKISLDLKDNTISDAKVSGIMFRGFEKFLKGQAPENILVYLPRICGICSISHSIAASNALAAISEDFKTPPNGQLAKNIAHATENAMSHITQFYVYFAPDLTDDIYKKSEFYPEIKRRFAQFSDDSSVKPIMEERKRSLEVIGLICGKWPHNLAIHPGGISKTLTDSDVIRIKGITAYHQKIIENYLFGMPVNEYLKIQTISDFDAAFGVDSKNTSDLAAFYRFSQDIGLFKMGQGPVSFYPPVVIKKKMAVSFLSPVTGTNNTIIWILIK